MKCILNDRLFGKIIKTFIEGFLATSVVLMSSVDDFSNMELVKSILVAAIASGLSAVLNIIQINLNKET